MKGNTAFYGVSRSFHLQRLLDLFYRRVLAILLLASVPQQQLQYNLCMENVRLHSAKELSPLHG